MRICVIAPVVIPVLGLKQKYGGIESVIYIACNELVKRGHEVYLFASADSLTNAKLIPTTKKALGLGTSFEQEKACNAIAYKMAIAKKADVIWDHTLAVHAHKKFQDLSKYVFKANIILQKDELIDTKNIPVVHTIHGQAKDHLPGIVHDLSLAGHYIVSISKDQARRFLEHMAIPSHLGTVYNAVDIEYFHPKNGDKTNDYLLWVGRYCMEKGPHIALQVAHKLKMPIKMIGKLDEPHEKEYFKKFIKPYLTKNDEDCGQATNSIKAKLYRDAKATLMTNLWAEPFGMVLAESMASGTPVVGPALGSLTELIDNAGLLINVQDIQINENDLDITSAQKKYIDKIVDGFNVIDKIPPQLPRKRAEFLFSPKHQADGYEEAFTKAIYLKHHKSSLNR